MEVRRQRVAAPSGTPVLRYATAPTMALAGMARIAAVHFGTPREIWSAHCTRAGISRREYDEYMSGATQASGLTMQEPLTFDEPVLLSSLQAVGAFHPPWSYRYLRSEDLRQATEASPFASSPALVADRTGRRLTRDAVRTSLMVTVRICPEAGRDSRNRPSRSPLRPDG
ncbi:hypothetical protein [Streptomyces qinglanensis]|uniref:hypothetical protein n=1 Tax=Streptomyces qinglanensis TaxID=943816 RepID=UPI000AB8A466|nr:hypothetical protein [Streptomyces qinglanensis]